MCSLLLTTTAGSMAFAAPRTSTPSTDVTATAETDALATDEADAAAEAPASLTGKAATATNEADAVTEAPASLTGKATTATDEADAATEETTTSPDKIAAMANEADAAAEMQPELQYWTKDSAAAQQIINFVYDVTNPESENFVAKEDRIAVFDFDGTLYGERYPTYFDTCLFMHRALHDESYEAPDEIRAYAKALEEALLAGDPEPDSPRSTAQMCAEMFAGMTIEEYRAYIREFMETPVWGFEGMTYGEGFFMPMVSLVEYLSENEFTIFISSGSERAIVRELIKGKLDQWIPSDRVIGSTFSLEATGQAGKNGRSYTYKPDDEVLLEGNLVIKNQKTNKVFSIVDEIGKAPVLVFGNSSGDLAMGEYAVQNGGAAFMLLCDDTVRDYGNNDVAEAFAAECGSFGLISMKDDFALIYKEDAVKTPANEQTTAVSEEAEEETVEEAGEETTEEAAEETQEEATGEETTEEAAGKTTEEATEETQEEAAKETPEEAAEEMTEETVEAEELPGAA